MLLENVPPLAVKATSQCDSRGWPATSGRRYTPPEKKRDRTLQVRLEGTSVLEQRFALIATPLTHSAGSGGELGHDPPCEYAPYSQDRLLAHDSIEQVAGAQVWLARPGTDSPSPKVECLS